MTDFKSVAIVGLGLIGGSLAKLIRVTFPHVQIYAVDRQSDTLEHALEDTVIDDGVSLIESLPKDIDLAIVCTPIDSVAAIINRIGRFYQSDIVITDVASVKSDILREVDDAIRPVYFPAHPMAGSNQTGYSFSDADLMRGAPFCVMPSDHPKWGVFKSFLNELSFNVVEIDSDRHDDAAAFVSHQSYWLSVCLGALANGQSDDRFDLFKLLAGPGFRSMTRLCGSDSDWGVDVALRNRDHLKHYLTGVRDTLDEVIHAVDSRDSDTLAGLTDNASRFYSRFYDV